MKSKSVFPKALTTVTPFSKTISLLVFILLPFVTFFVGTKYSIAPIFYPSRNIETTLKKDSQFVSQEGPWLTYQYKNPNPSVEFLPFGKGFKLYYNSTWDLQEKSRDPSYDYLNVILTNKDGSTVEIVHGEYGEGNCVFKDSSNYNDPDLMQARQFEKYTEITNGVMVWRLVNDEGKFYGLCEKEGSGKETFYKGINTIGIRNITLTSAQSLSDFKEMLKKIELYK